MKRFLGSVLFTIFLSLLNGCSPVTDYEVYGSIKGVVTDYDTDDQIKGASVMIVPGNQTVTTDESGAFEFLDLDAAQYTLSVQKSGYQANRKIVNVHTGETVNTAIILAKIPTE